MLCCAGGDPAVSRVRGEGLIFFFWEGGCLCEICTTKEAGDTLQARNCTLLQALLKWWIRVRFFRCYLLSMQGGTASHLKQ